MKVLDGVSLPFCLFAVYLSGVAKIVSDLGFGGLSWIIFAFLPLCLLSGVVKVESRLIFGGLRRSKFAFFSFCFLSREVKIVSHLIF